MTRTQATALGADVLAAWERWELGCKYNDLDNFRNAEQEQVRSYVRTMPNPHRRPLRSDGAAEGVRELRRTSGGISDGPRPSCVDAQRREAEYVGRHADSATPATSLHPAGPQGRTDETHRRRRAQRWHGLQGASVPMTEPMVFGHARVNADVTRRRPHHRAGTVRGVRQPRWATRTTA